MRIIVSFLVSLLVSVATEPQAAGAPQNADPPAPQVESRNVIALHVGIPDRIYLGQPLKELVERFPMARVVPFAGQSDAMQVQISDAGISCLVTGETPEELKVSSVGFNFDLHYEGVAAADFRTVEGVGRGSTVEDLVRAYGPPTEIIGPRTKPLAPRTVVVDPDAPMKHLYTNPEGTISTYFVVERGSVRRMSINDLAPLDRYILRRSPEGTAP